MKMIFAILVLTVGSSAFATNYFEIKRELKYGKYSLQDSLESDSARAMEAALISELARIFSASPRQVNRGEFSSQSAFNIPSRNVYCVYQVYDGMNCYVNRVHKQVISGKRIAQMASGICKQMNRKYGVKRSCKRG